MAQSLSVVCIIPLRLHACSDNTQTQESPEGSRQRSQTLAVTWRTHLLPKGAEHSVLPEHTPVPADCGHTLLWSAVPTCEVYISESVEEPKIKESKGGLQLNINMYGYILVLASC